MGPWRFHLAPRRVGGWPGAWSRAALAPRASAADWPDLLAYFKGFYGNDFFDWENDVIYYRLHPHWMTVYAPDLAKLTTASRS
ncbi:hypothetical protein [Nonomuraea sp. NPDC049400]|uniref:hypothetical protein n=1 Tax=Nonomuraea sp. NPDC049400 TaxID=3364352 RepID=UPI0037877DC0